MFEPSMQEGPWTNLFLKLLLAHWLLFQILNSFDR